MPRGRTAFPNTFQTVGKLRRVFSRSGSFSREHSLYYSNIPVVVRWQNPIDRDRSSFRHPGFAQALLQEIARAAGVAESPDREAWVEREAICRFQRTSKQVAAAFLYEIARKISY
jgi:hypothetical protein